MSFAMIKALIIMKSNLFIFVVHMSYLRKVYRAPGQQNFLYFFFLKFYDVGLHFTLRFHLT